MIKDFVKKIYKYCIDNFLLVHCAICFVALPIIMTTSIYILVKPNIVSYFDLFKYIYVPTKKIEIYSYLFTIPTIFTLFLSYILLIKNREFINNYADKKYNNIFKISILCVDLILNTFLFFKVSTGGYGTFMLITWGIVLVLPIILAYMQQIENNKNKFLIIFLLFSLINFGILYKDLTFNKLFIYNEFDEIPMTARVYLPQKQDNHFNIKNLFKKQENPYKLVDVNQYAEQNHIWGYRKFNDIRYLKKNLDYINCVTVNDITIKDVLNSIVTATVRNNWLIPKNMPTKKLIKNLSNDQKVITNYFYLANNKVCSIDKLSTKDIKLIKNNLNPKYNTDFNRILENNYNIPSRLQYQSYEELTPLQKEQVDFAGNLEGFLGRSSMGGFWFHHHNHILSAIVKLNLGVPQKEIYAQYGIGEAKLIKTIMDNWHGYNIGDYYNIQNSFYYIYYLIFLIALFVIFRNPTVALLIWGLTLITLNKFGYLHYYLAPGINPIRHFFDVLVIMFLFLYFKNNKKYNIILSDICAIGGIYLSSMYGIFLVLAICATFLIKQLERISKFEIINMFTLFIIGGISYLVFSSAPNPVSSSYLNGVYVYLATKPILIFIYCMITLGYMLFLRYYKSNSIYKHTFLFSLIYFQFILTYYITVSEESHFRVIAPLLFILIGLGVEFLLNNLQFNKKKFEIINTYACIITFVLLITVSFPAYLNNKRRVLCEVKEFQNYNWTIPYSNFKSSMNPKYITDSIDILKNPKYSANNKVYMISRHDNSLLLLANKMNAFPTIELSLNVTTKNDFEKIVNQIKTEKPEYLIIDKRILSNNLDSYVRKETFDTSFILNQQFKVLYNITAQVRQDYEPVDDSYLLTVWKIKE